MLGEANMKELAIVKTKQSRMDCRFHGNDSLLETGANLRKVANLPKVDGPNPASFPGEQCRNTPRLVPSNIQCKLDNHYYMGNAGNRPGKNFTGILPKSRFFGQKWLINILGETKTIALLITFNNDVNRLIIPKVVFKREAVISNIIIES